MQTVSSTLAVALAEAEASQSRSLQLKLGATLESKSSTFDEASTVPEEIPSSKQSPFTTKRLRDSVSYQIGGHCFRADDESSAGTPEEVEEDSHAKDVSLTRLQFVVTSVFGLREAARNKTSLFEHHASRLLMTSTGPNIVGGKPPGAHLQYHVNRCNCSFELSHPMQMGLLDVLGRLSTSSARTTQTKHTFSVQILCIQA
jgi:hypothetical protein